jgi:hypothetical protein
MKELSRRMCPQVQLVAKDHVADRAAFDANRFCLHNFHKLRVLDQVEAVSDSLSPK